MADATDTHPRKRQRSNSPEASISGTPHAPSRPAFTPHKNLWLEDGNIVLISQDRVGFRVHRTMLSRHSEVFRDMFIVARPPTSQDELLGDCPFIELSDSGDELAYLLDPIYAGGNGDHFRDTFKAPFEMVAAMAKLGTKYQVPHIRQEAIRRLSHDFPLGFHAWQYTKHFKRQITVFEGLAIAVLNLARLLDLGYMLPIAFYGCSCLPPAVLVNGIVRPNGVVHKLSQEDLTICLTGKDMMRDAIITGVSRAFKVPGCDEDCTTRKWTNFENLLVGEAGGDPLKRMGLIAIEGLCDDCYFSLESRLIQQRQKIWDEMGKYFGLDGAVIDLV